MSSQLTPTSGGRGPRNVRPIVLGLVSSRTQLAEALAHDFQVLVWHEKTGVEQSSSVDVILVDTTDDAHLSLVARLAHEEHSPVVVFGGSAVGNEDAPRYLDVGAADYISAHMTPIEQAARIRAAARRSMRSTHDATPDFEFGDIAVFVKRHEVWKAGMRVQLTPNEFSLLEALLAKADRPVTHRELMVRVWGPEHLSSRHYLRVYVRQLRGKLEDDPNDPSFILTEWGTGYRLATRDADVPQRVTADSA